MYGLCNVMQFIFILWLLFGCILFADEERKPNIIIILADDMGWSDLGIYGSEIPTPAIDSLGAQGVQATRFYTCARCSPSRASLMTGVYPQVAGVGFLDADFGQDFPGYRGGIDGALSTLPQILKNAGYLTYMAGKWHLGRYEGSRPKDKGFMRYQGLISGASSYDKIDKNRIFLMEDGDEISGAVPYEGFQMTDDITKKSLEYIADAAQNNKPFFLYVAYTAPHTPLQAKPKHIKHFLKIYEHLSPAGLWAERVKNQKKLGIIPHFIPSTSDGLPQTADRQEILKMAIYASQIYEMDQGVQQIIDLLKKTGVFDHTILFFLSDNGATKEEPPVGRDSKRPYPVAPYNFDLSGNGYGWQWASVSNAPWRGYKVQTFEGGIVAPCLVSYPDKIQSKMIISQAWHIKDIAATCLDWAGIPIPVSMQGRSLTKLIMSKTSELYLFWEHEKNRALLSREYKLVSQSQKSWQLYHVDDRMEQEDLSSQYPALVEKLARIYDQWAKANRVRFDYKIVY